MGNFFSVELIFEYWILYVQDSVCLTQKLEIKTRGKVPLIKLTQKKVWFLHDVILQNLFSVAIHRKKIHCYHQSTSQHLPAYWVFYLGILLFHNTIVCHKILLHIFILHVKIRSKSICAVTSVLDLVRLMSFKYTDKAYITKQSLNQ